MTAKRRAAWLLAGAVPAMLCGCSGHVGDGAAGHPEIVTSTELQTVPATCAAAPADKKPPQDFYVSTFHADLQTTPFGLLEFDRGAVDSASESSITLRRNVDGAMLTFPVAAAYRCGLTAAAALGAQVSIVSRAGTAVAVWPTSTQTPAVFKLAYHGVFDFTKGDGSGTDRIATLTSDFGWVQDWAGHVPGPLTYRRGDDAVLTVQTNASTSWGKPDGHLSPEQVRPCQLVQVITGPGDGELKIRANDPATHPEGNPLQRQAAGPPGCPG